MWSWIPESCGRVSFAIGLMVAAAALTACEDREARRPEPQEVPSPQGPELPQPEPDLPPPDAPNTPRQPDIP